MIGVTWQPTCTMRWARREVARLQYGDTRDLEREDGEKVLQQLWEYPAHHSNGCFVVRATEWRDVEEEEEWEEGKDG